MMNLIDLALLIGVIACAGWGAKRGFVRMVMITLGLCASIVIAVHYNDAFTRELSGYFHASPLWVSMWAFVIASMLLFAMFRLLDSSPDVSESRLNLQAHDRIQISSIFSNFVRLRGPLLVTSAISSRRMPPIPG
jgi:hypothetical protein